MKVEDLLNPVRGKTDTEELRSVAQISQQPQQHVAYSSRSPTMSYTSSPVSMAYSPSLPSKARSHKLPKDAPIFRKAPTNGMVRFPPYEAGDDKLLADQYRKFQLFPMGEIADHCNRIPYSSDKKKFTANTGRESFEGKPDPILE
jgi:hypothetical protein